MIPLSDDNPTLRRPVMTWVLLAAITGVWLVVQGAGLDELRLAASVCNYGLVPGELTGRAALGFELPIARGIACAGRNGAVHQATPAAVIVPPRFVGHLVRHGLVSVGLRNHHRGRIGPGRFLVFYLLCGLVAAAAH